MKLFWAEFRQVINRRVFLIFLAIWVTILGLLYMQMHTVSYVSYPHLQAEESPLLSSADLGRALADIVVEKGNTVATQEDLDALRESHLPDRTRLDTFFKTSKESHALGIHSLDEYISLFTPPQNGQEDMPEETYAVMDKMNSILEKENLLLEAQKYRSAVSSFLELQKAFDNRHKPETYMESLYTSQRETARMTDILHGEMASPIPFMTSTVISAYAVPYTLLALWSILFLLLPYIWRSRSQTVHLVQYTCKAGRHILRIQFLSSAVLSAILLLLFALPIFYCYSQMGILKYWNLSLTGFLDKNFYWLHLTVGNYITLLFSLWFITGIGVSLLSTCISRLFRNFVTCVACSLPLAGIVYFVWEWIFARGFLLNTMPFMETFLSVSLLLLGIAGAWFLCHREKKLDII